MPDFLSVNTHIVRVGMSAAYAIAADARSMDVTAADSTLLADSESSSSLTRASTAWHVQEDADSPSELAQHLGVKRFPSVLFFRNGQIIWRADGSHGLQGDVMEGLLYFGESSDAASAVSRHVQELPTPADFDSFVSGKSSESTLQMVMLTTPLCSPCIHAFPTYVTLAANFAGLIDFARLESDSTPEVNELFGKLRVLEAPTFLVYRDGKEIDRNVSSNRGDLIGHLLGVAVQNGIQPPRPAKR
jgi:thioredoxin-like negative regulator of GroEL